MIPALASIFDICWVITDRCMYGPPPAPALTQPLRVRMLHFPPSGRAGAEAGWCLAMHRFKFTAMYGNYKFEFSIQNIDQHMYMYPPAPTPWECGSSTFLPWERPALGQASTPLICWFKLIVVCVIYEYLKKKKTLIKLMKFRKTCHFFSQNNTEINSDDWTITQKTSRTIKHENLSKMKILKVDRWALSLNGIHIK